MPNLLDDRIVFLTGGGQGIGRECALAYSREGATVIIADIDGDAAQQTLTDLDHGGLALACDISQPQAVEQAIAEALRQFGRLDVVHNNAGISSPSKPIHETTLAEWDRLHHTNLRSVYLTTYYAIDSLIASQGCILNTASMVGLIGQQNHAAYVASKGGMIALTKAMALDYAPFRVRVNAVCPAGVWTPLLRQWVSEQAEPAAMEQYLNDIHPLGYCPDGDAIADVAVFLVSDRARFITGCILPVSGGAELGYRR